MTDLFSSAIPVIPFDVPAGEGYTVTRSETWNGFDVTVPGGAFFYAEGFFNRAWSDRTLEYLQENDTVDWRTANWRASLADISFRHIAWKQDSLKMYGKAIPLPRLTAWYGDAGKTYTYSGITSQPNPWNEGLLHLKHRIEACAGAIFNSVLLNWYRDGRDYLGWHADDEKELGRDPVIASANFGATRDFVLRRNGDHAQQVTLPLKHGTLLVMKGSLQHHWQHQVPKRTKVGGSRFNLTFRHIKS